LGGGGSSGAADRRVGSVALVLDHDDAIGPRVRLAPVCAAVGGAVDVNGRVADL